MSETDILVIGAGPAGLGAAIAAARQGARTLVLDALPRPGGAYWMQPPGGTGGGAQAEQGAARIAEAHALGVGFVQGAELVSCRSPAEVTALQDRRLLTLQARALVVATGAMDRAVAFPGWDLPGVLSAAAAQRLLKLSATLPGRRLVVAGTGPFLLLVAAQLARAGAELIAVLDAASRPGRLWRLLAFPERLGEAWAIARPLLRAGSLRHGWMVARALGRERVQSVEIVRGDRRERLDGIDALIVGWGLQPRTEVTRLLGCAHRHDPALGGWTCVADPRTGATSVEGVFAAGEVRGVRGAEVAWLEGLEVGSAAAAAIGKGAIRTAAGRGRARAFAATLARLWPLPAAATRLADATTLLCRCEAIAAAEVDAAIADGARTVAAAKRWTRCGMGPCQGRVCAPLIADRLHLLAGVTPTVAGLNAPRLPLVPVPLAAFAAERDRADAEPPAC